MLAWAAITKEHRRGGLSNRNLLLTVLEAVRNAGLPRCRPTWFLVRAPHLACS